MANIDLLGKVDAFQDLSRKQMSAVIECGEIFEFKKGDKLFSEGEDSKHLWIVIDGQVELRYEVSGGSSLSRTNLTLTIISKAQTFGWSCFVPPVKYRLSGYCGTQNCEIFKIEKDCLEKLFDKDPDIGFHIMKFLVKVVGSHFNNYQEELAKQLGNDIMSGW